MTDYLHRTDESFAQQIDDAHHNGPNPFSPLDFGMVSQFPLDYMHLVCLGVVRRLLNLWLRGPLKSRLSAKVVDSISSQLVKMRPKIPVEFARKPRSLREVDRWKATEFRQFLLYTDKVVLSSFFDSNTYNNFMLLFMEFQFWLVRSAPYLIVNMLICCSELLLATLVTYMAKSNLFTMFMGYFTCPMMSNDMAALTKFLHFLLKISFTR